MTIKFKQVFSYLNPLHSSTVFETEDNLDSRQVSHPNDVISLPIITFKDKVDNKFTDPKDENQEIFYDAIEISNSVVDVRFPNETQKAELVLVYNFDIA